MSVFLCIIMFFVCTSCIDKNDSNAVFHSLFNCEFTFKPPGITR